MAGVTVRLDEERWQAHLATVLGDTPAVVPVVKGHGYGFGLVRLAAECRRLGVGTIAVGLPSEVGVVHGTFEGDVVILQPYDPADGLARTLTAAPHVLTTVSRLDDLRGLAAGDGRPRVLVEVQTSMRRHGLRPDELAQAAPLLDDVVFEGWSIHLPMREEGRREEAERLARTAVQARLGPLWLSHLPAAQVRALGEELGVDVRARVGTRLWLGDAKGRTVTATVLDVHPVRRGERAGYRGRVVPGAGWVVVVAGGTSHGVGLEAPTSATTWRQRATALATGSLGAAGRALSPFTLDGRKRWFLEPPHMQSSQVFLPAGATPPAVGDEVPVELRLTIATLDAVIMGSSKN
ncbi:alanine racemase [Microlunatus flavus]|uniref:Alanine racemase n=1 Tax=Microlunatus flavus TaxID=1036181 RepID=A0A1H9AK51_9ACTN|nr:alanine racemase [Microlunatus flavus]SEP76753.1 Alanine racemase [Microlunatus flavus]